VLIRWKPRVFAVLRFQGWAAAPGTLARAARATASSLSRWQFLYFFPDPQWQESLRPGSVFVSLKSAASEPPLYYGAGLTYLRTNEELLAEIDKVR
jgi:hypothetical protein